MYKCYICRLWFGTPVSLTQHIKLVHGLYPGKQFNLICAQESCSLQFKSFLSFRKHLFNYHKERDWRDGVSSNSSLSRADQAVNVREYILYAGNFHTDQDLPNQQASGSAANISKDQSKEMCASIIAKLQGSGVANNVILSVVESMEEYVDEVHINLK